MCGVVVSPQNEANPLSFGLPYLYGKIYHCHMSQLRISQMLSGRIKLVHHLPRIDCRIDSCALSPHHKKEIPYFPIT